MPFVRLFVKFLNGVDVLKVYSSVFLTGVWAKYRPNGLFYYGTVIDSGKNVTVKFTDGTTSKVSFVQKCP